MTSGKRRPRSAKNDAPRPARRSPGVKVSSIAARSLRAGHPWVFREALHRQLDLEAGKPVPVSDEDGQRIGTGLFEPEGAVAVRMVGYADGFTWDRDAIEARLRAALKYREMVVGPEIAGAHRLVHGEADGLPAVAVDRLGEYLLVYQYGRSADAWVETLVDALDDALSPRGIYLQDRSRGVQPDEPRSGAKLLRGKVPNADFEVEEDGLKFLVDVTAPVSPGLFLDLREGRRLVERWAPGRRVLNLFSFTGAFGLRAVRGGAAEVVNVDAAARSHARCRQNLSASGLDPEACEAVSGDVFKHLEKFRRRDRKFDLVVVDPPPFSSVDGAVFSALRDWSELMTAIADVADAGALVLAVCNAAGLPDGDFLDALGAGVWHAQRDARVVDECGLPSDFPVLPAFTEGRYLRAKLLHLP